MDDTHLQCPSKTHAAGCRSAKGEGARRQSAWRTKEEEEDGGGESKVV